MKELQKKDEYAFSRFLYVIEATLEYFVSLAVTSVYLAKLTAYIGISDGLTGILSSFVSLASGFQLVAIFFARKTPVKIWVTTLHIVSDAMFALLYFTPLFHFSRTVKTVMFVVLLLGANVLNKVVNSPKTNWYMSLVDDKKRGRFTANKEITSLITGMAFSYFMGAMMDHFELSGDMRGAFVVGGITICVLMVSHALSLIFAKEKPMERKENASIGKEIKALLKDKALLKVVGVSVFWGVATYISTPFFGTYQTKELGFSTSFASVIVMAASLCRVFCSKPLGKFADKHSFADMLIICFGLETLAFAINTFTNPSNGHVLYVLYLLLYYAGMAGINSSVINLIYDYVGVEKRTSALALKSALAGVAGFLTTLVVSPFVSFMQENGNVLFGVNVYAQQVLSLISCLCSLGVLLYMIFVVRKIPKQKENE